MTSPTPLDIISEAIRQSGDAGATPHAHAAADDAQSQTQAQTEAIRFDPTLLIDPSLPASVEAFRRDGLLQHLRRYSAHQHVRNAIHRLQDAEWLRCWEQALPALSERRVAMHGSGLGLLALRAIELGARHVQCIEPSAQTARIAAGLSHKHHLAAWHDQHREAVRQWDEATQRASFDAFTAAIDIIVDEPGSRHAIDRDAFIFTDIDHTLLGTGIVPAVRAFLAGRDAADAAAPIVLPARATVHAMAVQWCDPDPKADLSALRARRWNAYPQPFDMPASCWRALTTATRIVDIDFANFTPGDHPIEMQIVEDGIADAIVFWYDLELGDVLISTSPQAATGSLRPAMQYIDPVSCRVGDRLPLCLRLRETRLSLLSDPPPGQARGDTLPGWHLSMLADTVRDGAYRAAIGRVLSECPDARVLNPGTGCGTLALMLQRAGAADVTTTGHVPALARAGADVIAANDTRGVIRHIARDLRRLSIPEDMPTRADMVVFDQFDCSLIGEGILHYLAHARTHLLADDARVLPASAVLRGQLIEHRFDRIFGIDASLLNPFLYAPGFVNVDASRIPWSPLGEPFELFRFDFATAGPDPQRMRIDVETQACGVASAVLFWFELDLDAQTRLSNAPGTQPASHWGQGLQFLPEAMVDDGMRMSLVAEHDGAALKFGWDADALDRSRLLPMPRFDPRTAMAAAELEQRTRELLQHCAQAADERARVADIAMRVAVEPGAHRVDPVIAQRFLSLLMGH